MEMMLHCNKGVESNRRLLANTFNGKSQTKEQVFEAIKNLHANSTMKLNSLQDLAVTPGIVAQVSKSTVTTGGSAKEQTTVRIVKVEERGGKKVMTSLVMVQAA
ncbi:hypothetical protein B0H17DRAFT_1339398 [Mycena rosella]|uniref:Uncharacterized protein n=1 Tax=Mycena rosella TaxID=1033263 RepID=A0AAD7C659_MYCRO|nr:hypothetical protein B0H17DRAFT_1339398 [Mycena rosella]